MCSCYFQDKTWLLSGSRKGKIGSLTSGKKARRVRIVKQKKIGKRLGGLFWSENSTGPESSKNFKLYQKVQEISNFSLNMCVIFKFLELSVFMYFRRVFTPRFVARIHLDVPTYWFDGKFNDGEFNDGKLNDGKFNERDLVLLKKNPPLPGLLKRNPLLKHAPALG